MAINFPNNPSDGDTHVASNLTYTYDAAKGIWNISDQTAVTADLSNVATNILPTATNTYNLGSDARRWNHLYLNGNSLFLGNATISSTGTAVNLPAGSTVGGTAIGSGSGGVEVLADMAALIAKTGMNAGDQAFVSATNGLYIYNGTGWYLIASVTNQSPTAITGVDATYALATDGTPTVITAVSSDPEGFPLTWSYAVTSGALGTTATVSQADNVFTVTPGTTDPDDAGTFELTFSATDGTTGAVNAAASFTLVFATASKKLTGSGYATVTSNERQNFLRTGGLSIAFSADGTKMYHCTFSNIGITEYDLTTPWDINTATELGSFALNSACGIMMTSDGSYFIAAERSANAGTIAVYATQTAHSVIGATMVGSSYDCSNVPNYGSVVNACGMSDDGTRVWWQHQSSNKSVFAVLLTPYNASTVSLSGVRELDANGGFAGSGNILASCIDRNGAVIHVTDWVSNSQSQIVRQYVLQSPWTWTATETNSYIDSNMTDHFFSNPGGNNWSNASFTFTGAENPTGNNMFFSEYGNGDLTQFAATVGDI